MTVAEPLSKKSKAEAVGSKGDMAGTPVEHPTSAFLVQRLSADATVPTKGSKLAAGYDLYA